MPIVIDVVCPSCGKLTKANILEKTGSTSTHCPFCHKTIEIHTNDQGKVTKIKAGF